MNEFHKPILVNIVELNLVALRDQSQKALFVGVANSLFDSEFL